MAIDPKRVQAIFIAAVDAANTTIRAAIVERECGNDVDLRRRIEALLHAHDARPMISTNRP